MKWLKFNILLLMLSFALQSCEEEVDIDLDQVEPKLVVNALVTDKPSWNWVQLSLSSAFDATSPPKYIQNALVIISDGKAVDDTFQYYESGFYFMSDSWIGEVGNTYQLEIHYDGEIFLSSATMLPVTPIDSLTYSFRDKNVDEDDIGYYTSLYFQEPPGIHYYRWLYFENSKPIWDEEFISDDMLFENSYVNGYELDEEAQLGDTVRIEQYSLSKECYEFLRQIREQDEFGDPFDTPPANVQGNISNGALGQFMVSSVSTAKIIIQ